MADRSPAAATKQTRRDQRIAAIALLAVAAPFAVRLVQAMLFATGHASMLADSPAGYVIEVVFDSLLAVVPGALAFGIWRRPHRGALKDAAAHRFSA